MTIIAFWKVGSYDVERHTLDDVSDLEAFKILYEKRLELDVRFYNMDSRSWSDPLSRFGIMNAAEFEEDYNDEYLDGEMWVKHMVLNPIDVESVGYDHLNDEHPRECEFYSIEDGEVHISGFLWLDDRNRWRLTEYSRCFIPLKEFVPEYKKSAMQFVDECESEVQQYERDSITWGEALYIYNNYFGEGEEIEVLPYGMITEETKSGFYKTA